MNLERTVFFHWLIPGLLIMTASAARSEVVTYTLDNIVLDDNNAQMLGTFTWTYEVGDFENGLGEFTFLDIPFTLHDHTDLDATIDIGSSIEITLDGSVHDDGVDITLFLSVPLTPTTGSSIDLDRSKYEIGGNGFHDGAFLSGGVLPEGVSEILSTNGQQPNRLAMFPNPFNPRTTVTYFVANPGPVRVSIHDVHGRLRTTLIDEWHPHGHHSVPWNAEELGSGLYFVRYVAGAESTTHRALLIR